MEKENPELAGQIGQESLNGDIPEIDYKNIPIKPDSPTRGVSAAVLGEFSSSSGEHDRHVSRSF